VLFPVVATVRRRFDIEVHRVARIAYGLARAADPARYGLTFIRDIPYRDTGKRAHRLDVYRPRGLEPRPAVLYIHGGGFSMLSKDTHRLFALMLATRGYVVFNANYRLAPRHRYPRPLRDVADALAFVQEHGPRYGADTSRIALCGESAGANLVTSLAFAATHPRPEPFARRVYELAPSLRAVVPFYGLHDLHDLERLWRDRRLPWYVRAEIEFVAAAYVGRPRAERALRCPMASPLRLLAETPGAEARPLPPFFAACGTADPLLDDSVRLKALLEARGTPCELHVFPGELHGFNAMLWRDAARKKWSALFRFLRRHLDGRS
jgi:acetyl esterase